MGNAKTGSDASIQRDYHLGLFDSLASWGVTQDFVFDLSGDRSVKGLLGLDQMGHFGPNGCDLVVDALAGGDAVDRICEIGSGFGGALRQIASALRRVGHDLRLAVGLDLVERHTIAAREIGLTVDGTNEEFVCASADTIPFRSASFDAVICTGSAPHFRDMAKVLREVASILRPGGRLVMTEEVSLYGELGDVSDQFRAFHPADTFFVTDFGTRLEQIRAAGFEVRSSTDLTDWAIALLTDRLRAIGLLRGSAERVYGRSETARIEQTLQVALAEYRSGGITPRLLDAVRA